MRTDRLLLQDILEAADEVTEATPATREEFDANKYLRSHVLRHIQIIGEAAWRLPAETRDQHPQIPWKLIIGMRHVLVHDYFGVNWTLVYETARNHVPALKSMINLVLQSLPPDRQ